MGEGTWKKDTVRDKVSSCWCPRPPPHGWTLQLTGQAAGREGYRLRWASAKKGKVIPGAYQLLLHLQDRLIFIIEPKEATKRWEQVGAGYQESCRKSRWARVLQETHSLMRRQAAKRTFTIFNFQGAELWDTIYFMSWRTGDGSTSAEFPSKTYNLNLIMRK